MKYTFVCDYGRNRSPAAARVMQELLAEQGKRNGAIRHAGIEQIMPQSEFDKLHRYMFENVEPTSMSHDWERDFLARRQEAECMKTDIEGADRVFVMEPEMAEQVRAKTTYTGEITILGILNDYSNPQDQNLRAALREKLKSFLR